MLKIKRKRIRVGVSWQNFLKSIFLKKNRGKILGLNKLTKTHFSAKNEPNRGHTFRTLAIVLGHSTFQEYHDLSMKFTCKSRHANTESTTSQNWISCFLAGSVNRAAHRCAK